jgi:mitochondrial intermediate peptidase
MLGRPVRATLQSSSRCALFRFRGCLNEPQRDHVPTRFRLAKLTTVASPATSEDVSLVPFFDQPRAHLSHSVAPTGLFAHDGLKSPKHLLYLAQGTLQRASLLTERILRASESKSDLQLAVKNLDKLSDLLCGVIDLAEVVRNSHPDPMWVGCANETYEMLYEFLNVLNTHVGLYQVRSYVLPND